MKCIVFWDLAISTDHSIPLRRHNVNKINCHLTGFAIPLDHCVKIKAKRYINTYILPESQKKMTNIKGIMTLIVVNALGTISKGLEMRLGTLKSARILRRVLETCCHSNFRENPPVKNAVKNSQ